MPIAAVFPPASRDPEATPSHTGAGCLRPLPGTGLAPQTASSLWRGSELGSQVTSTVSTGWQALDAELPGGGWPARSLTEILSAQPSVVEWRLLSACLRACVASDRQVVVVGPPKHPHLPGLRHEGLDQRHLVWIRAEAPAERLWTTEQLVKSNGAGAVVAWLPQARQDQLRRLQVCALSCDAPVFVMRPIAARHEASPAPLRVEVGYALDWQLEVRILKRRGPLHDGTLRLPSVPGGLDAVLTPRLRKPSSLFEEKTPAVVSLRRRSSAAPSLEAERHAAVAVGRLVTPPVATSSRSVPAAR